MRHSYLRSPTSNSGTIPVYYLLALLRIARCSTPNVLLRIARCPALYSQVSGPTSYKCAPLHIDTIRCPSWYKNPTPVGADRFRLRQFICYVPKVQCLVQCLVTVFENPQVPADLKMFCLSRLVFNCVCSFFITR